jgi:hypothetical protein
MAARDIEVWRYRSKPVENQVQCGMLAAGCKGWPCVQVISATGIAMPVISKVELQG